MEMQLAEAQRLLERIQALCLRGLASQDPEERERLQVEVLELADKLRRVGEGMTLPAAVGVQ